MIKQPFSPARWFRRRGCLFGIRKPNNSKPNQSPPSLSCSDWGGVVRQKALLLFCCLLWSHYISSITKTLVLRRLLFPSISAVQKLKEFTSIVAPSPNSMLEERQPWQHPTMLQCSDSSCFFFFIVIIGLKVLIWDQFHCLWFFSLGCFWWNPTPNIGEKLSDTLSNLKFQSCQT